MKEDRFLKAYGFLHLWLFAAGLLLLVLRGGGALTLGAGAKLLLLAAPAVLLREIAGRGKKIWSYLGASIGSLGIFWLLGQGVWEKTCLLLGLLFFIVLFFWQRIAGNRELFFRPSYACLLFFALEYMVSLTYGLEGLERLFLCFTGCYWLLILWSRNRKQFLDYCGTYDRLYRFPKEGIAWGSRKMLLFLTVLTVGCMTLLPSLGLDRGILAVLTLLRRFLTLLLSGKGEEASREAMPEEAGQMPPLLPEPGEEPSPFLEAFWGILEKFLLLAVILGAAAGICALLLWLYKRYSSQAEENGDIVESLEAPKEESRERIKRRRPVLSGFFKARTPRDRIRRAYKQKIEKAGKPSASASPQELEEQAGLPRGAQREEFHTLYEKARYGNLPCSQEEASRMKQLERVDFL